MLDEFTSAAQFKPSIKSKKIYDNLEFRGLSDVRLDGARIGVLQFFCLGRKSGGSPKTREVSAFRLCLQGAPRNAGVEKGTADAQHGDTK